MHWFVQMLLGLHYMHTKKVPLQTQNASYNGPQLFWVLKTLQFPTANR